MTEADKNIMPEIKILDLVAVASRVGRFVMDRLWCDVPAWHFNDEDSLASPLEVVSDWSNEV